MAASQTQTSRHDPESSPLDGVDLSKLEGIGEAPRSNGSSLSIDETFELLKNARRRAVIRFLLEHDGSAKLSELAEHIAAAENDISVHELSSDQRKRVYIGLYQCHLPKMDNLGVIEYDKNRGSVVLQDSVTQLLPYMESLADDGEESVDLVPGLAAAIAVLVIVGSIGVGPLALIPVLGWTVLSVAGLVGIALLHHSR